MEAAGVTAAAGPPPGLEGSGGSTSDEGEPSDLPMCNSHHKSWLEVADTQHRYAKHLRCYYREWERCGSVGSFWEWLDTMPLVTLPDCPREKLQASRVTYLRSAEERAPFTLEAHDGQFYHPAGAGDEGQRQLYSTGEGEWIFVMAPSRVLFCNRKVRGAFHHTSFLAGGPCLAAGSLIIRNGVLLELYPHSGHYRPGERHLHVLLLQLLACGVSLTSFTVDVQRLYKVARADGNGAKKQTCMMKPATTALAFLETKLRASKASLFDELVLRTHSTQYRAYRLQLYEYVYV